MQQSEGYQKELFNLIKDTSILNDMMTKEYREEQEENRLQEEKEIEQRQYEKWLEEQRNKKKPKMYGIGSKFTKSKKKRK